MFIVSWPDSLREFLDFSGGVDCTLVSSQVANVVSYQFDRAVGAV